MTPAKEAAAVHLRAQGKTLLDISEALGVSVSTVVRSLGSREQTTNSEGDR